ncbi:MAG: hydrogenase 4 subunit B [Peptococcaceae bacterium]|nr:hydrogenase 4 subunit B [Peptococcaceae bacterium]
MVALNEYLFFGCEGLLLLGGLLSFVLQTKAKLSMVIAFAAASIACLGGLGLGLNVLLAGNNLNLTLPWSLASSAITFTVGPLEAFFITVSALVCFAVSIYSVGYVQSYIGKHNVGVLGLLYCLFIFAIIGLIASGSAVLFLFLWELMSIVSYLLVVYHHRDSQVRQAGFTYVVMTHIGTMFIVLAFLLMYVYAGSFSFAGYILVGRSMPAAVKNIIFLLVAIGFGTKAGIIPLHVWLPKAHPAAPSNVSAIMSGVMIKTAIFGLIKFIFVILGNGPAWWGILLLVIGSASALLGVLYSLMETDIKRFLAYCSVENMGVILLGMGAAMVLARNGFVALAAVALMASMFHVLNHAIFKGLLFLGAGSVNFATGTRNIEKMGGLLRRMPWTGLFFLVASVSIAALPPFNGFISEWLTFQSLLALGASGGNLFLEVLGPLAGAGLALTSALSAAGFVRAFGIQFLALPRSSGAKNAKEVPISMRIGMGILAALCPLLGVVPFIIIKLLAPVTAVLLGVHTAPVLGNYFRLSIPSGVGQHTALSALLVPSLLGMAGLVAYLVVKYIGKGGSVRYAETWNCGTTLTPRMEYTGTAFAKPLRMIFRQIFLPEREVKTEYTVEPYFKAEMSYEGKIKPVFEDVLYRPVTRLFVVVANKIRVLQSGSIHLYLLYMFATLVLLLIFAR